MTRAIFVRGDLSCPGETYAYDATSGKKIRGLDSMSIRVTSGMGTEAMLYFDDGRTESVALVGGPPLPDEDLLAVRIERSIDSVRHCDKYKMVLSVLRETDGLLDPIFSTSADQDISHTSLASVPDPDVLVKKVVANLGSSLGSVICAGLWQSMKATGLPSAGQMPAKVPAAPAAKCGECGGTGEVMLFSGSSPCSKGCKKP